jgi:hypothetical protein
MTDCPICLDKINDSIYVTFCGHIFHKDCIHASLERDIRCPICRRDITKTGSKKVFWVNKEGCQGNKWSESRDMNGIILSSVPVWI